jgi:hypothetical protein
MEGYILKQYGWKSKWTNIFHSLALMQLKNDENISLRDKRKTGLVIVQHG